MFCRMISPLGERRLNLIDFYATIHVNLKYIGVQVTYLPVHEFRRNHSGLRFTVHAYCQRVRALIRGWEHGVRLTERRFGGIVVRRDDMFFSRNSLLP